MDAVVIKDDVDLPGRVEPDDVAKKTYEPLSPFVMEDLT